MLDQLEKIFASQKRFNSDVAHELRNPMAVILNQCEYTKAHMDDRENLEETIDVIYRQARKANDIIQRLLKLSRLERNQVELKKEWILLDDLLQAVCEEERSRTTKAVEFQFDTEHQEVFVDVTLLMVLFHNIVNNAIRYSVEHATISIAISSTENDVVTSIQDYGCGMTKESAEHIFEPFYRADQSRNSDGVGLGLAIAAQIAEIHGGRIEVTSEVGRGSRFDVYLSKN